VNTPLTPAHGNLRRLQKKGPELGKAPALLV
jgi:hypothetical protein